MGVSRLTLTSDNTPVQGPNERDGSPPKNQNPEPDDTNEE